MPNSKIACLNFLRKTFSANSSFIASIFFGLLICSIFLIIFVELQIEGIILSLFAGYISMEVVFDIFMNNDSSIKRSKINAIKKLFHI